MSGIDVFDGHMGVGDSIADEPFFVERVSSDGNEVTYTENGRGKNGDVFLVSRYGHDGKVEGSNSVEE